MENIEEEMLDLEEQETKVREARMALVATEIRGSTVLLYEFLPIEEARKKIEEFDKNAF